MATERLKIEIPPEQFDHSNRRPSVWVDIQRCMYRRGSVWHDARVWRCRAAVLIVVIVLALLLFFGLQFFFGFNIIKFTKGLFRTPQAESMKSNVTSTIESTTKSLIAVASSTIGGIASDAKEVAEDLISTITPKSIT